MIENLQLRQALGLNTKGIRRYTERISPEWELNNSYDLINLALKEEQKELESAQVKNTQQNNTSYGIQLVKSTGIGLVTGGAIGTSAVIAAKITSTAINWPPTNNMQEIIIKTSEQTAQKTIEEITKKEALEQASWGDRFWKIFAFCADHLPNIKK